MFIGENSGIETYKDSMGNLRPRGGGGKLCIMGQWFFTGLKKMDDERCGK